MTTFSAVVVSHANVGGLQLILDNLAEQTRRPDEVLVYACCLEEKLSPPFAAADSGTITSTEHRGDWGHADRAQGLAKATGDFVGFFNDDDAYDDRYLELLLAAVEQHDDDVAYCDWNAIPRGCDFRHGHSTSGNFIVRTEIARAAGGWPATAVYENDGRFIDAVAAVTDRIVHVPLVLYTHNAR